jgi:hypothetical protein
VVIDSPPFQVGQEVWGRLRRGPGSTSQRGYSMTDSQMHPFDKGRVEPSREAKSLQDDGESILGSQTHHVRHSHERGIAGSFSSLGHRSVLLPLATGVFSALGEPPGASVQNGL